MAQSLEKLGFETGEIYDCEFYSSGRILVPATIAGEAARLILDTEQRIDLALWFGYARSREFPYERSGEGWGKSPLTEFECLGKSRPHDIVVVHGTESETQVYYTAGKIGAEYIDGSTVAVDPVDLKVGLSIRSDVRECFARARYRLPLLSGIHKNLPVTAALRDNDIEDAHPVFMVDTARSNSVLSFEYVKRYWSGGDVKRARKASEEDDGRIEVRWRMPDGKAVWLDTEVWNACTPSYAAQLGVPSLDGFLGLDFLYQWLPVFDLAGRELALFDLG